MNIEVPDEFIISKYKNYIILYSPELIRENPWPFYSDQHASVYLCIALNGPWETEEQYSDYSWISVKSLKEDGEDIGIVSKKIARLCKSKDKVTKSMGVELIKEKYIEIEIFLDQYYKYKSI